VTSYIGRYGWNTFLIGSAVTDDELREAIDTSYADVVGRLPKSKRPS
jgi:predicted DNA-binding protein (MmcQ/YjbR family)